MLNNYASIASNRASFGISTSSSSISFTQNFRDSIASPLKVGKTIMSKPFNRLYHLVKVIQSPVPHHRTGTEPIENSQFSILNSQSFGAVNAQ